MSFSKKIEDWYEENQRSLPWRNIDDPYKIWLSEIILQQTRIEQGRAYYLRFVEQYPTVRHLAEASEDDVLKVWQGLGYYSRARNLHEAAKYIAFERNGVFPDNYNEILKLKGVGRYTAAAIASFAFRLPHPVIDGNVYRLVSRVYGITTPIGTNAAYSEFESLLLRLIDTQRPDLFNQAMMDFGSTYCKPQPVDCTTCIFASQCMAWRDGIVALLPVKMDAAKVKQRWLYYYHIIWESEGKEYTLVHQRTGQDIWKGLYEFPLVESDHDLSELEREQQDSQFLLQFAQDTPISVSEGDTFIHKLTHRTINATFVHANLSNVSLQNDTKEFAILTAELEKLPVSRLIDRYLSKKSKNVIAK